MYHSSKLKKLAVPLSRLESYAELLCYRANLLVEEVGFEPTYPKGAGFTDQGSTTLHLFHT